jgi:hypothetical protein
MMAEGVSQVHQNCGDNAGVISCSCLRLIKNSEGELDHTEEESAHRSSHANQPDGLARVGVFDSIVIRERFRGLNVFLVEHINLIVAKAVLVQDFGVHIDLDGTGAVDGGERFATGKVSGEG